MPYFRKYCGRGWSGRNANSTTIDFIFGSEMPSIDFKPCLEQMENSFVGRGQISPISVPTLKIFKNWTCHFFWNFTSDWQHQDIWWKKVDVEICRHISDMSPHHQFPIKCIPKKFWAHLSCYFFLDRTLAWSCSHDMKKGVPRRAKSR